LDGDNGNGGRVSSGFRSSSPGNEFVLEPAVAFSRGVMGNTALFE